METTSTIRHPHPDRHRLCDLLLRPAAVPLDRVRRPGAARGRGLQGDGALHRGLAACPRRRRAHLGRIGRPDLERSSASRTAKPRRRSSSTPTYAPIPSDTRAILRQKTLLGETYVELTPGSEEAEPVPEGGGIPMAQVSDSVQLDEVFRTFDPRTQEAFRAWMQGQASALAGPRRGPVRRDRPHWSRSPTRPTASCACSTRRSRR